MGFQERQASTSFLLLSLNNTITITSSSSFSLSPPPLSSRPPFLFSSPNPPSTRRNRRHTCFSSSSPPPPATISSFPLVSFHPLSPPPLPSLPCFVSVSFLLSSTCFLSSPHAQKLVAELLACLSKDRTNDVWHEQWGEKRASPDESNRERGEEDEDVGVTCSVANGRFMSCWAEKEGTNGY
eukprot:73910-Hanusia_phi.AAC.1